MAVKSCNITCVKLLLEHKANPNIFNNGGSTPLYKAVLSGKTECVQLLLERNADPQIANLFSGESLLDIANQKGNTECAQLLSRYGAEVGHGHISRWFVHGTCSDKDKDRRMLVFTLIFLFFIICIFLTILTKMANINKSTMHIHDKQYI